MPEEFDPDAVENQPPEEDGDENQLPEPEEGFQYVLDADGNVEVDADGEPLTELVEAQPEFEPPTPEEEEVPVQAYLPQGEGSAASKLKEHLADPETFALVQAMVREENQRALQSFGVAQASLSAAAAEHPEIFRFYGAKINANLALFPEQERHTRKAVDIATMLAIEHKAGTPEFPNELLKFAQKLAGKATATAPKAPKAPIPPEQRPPSPASAGRSAPRVNRAEKELAARFGMKGRALADLMEDL